MYNVTCSGKQSLDPREFCFMMKLGLESRHRKTFDWGYGDDGVELFENLKWIPQEGYEVRVVHTPLITNNLFQPGLTK